MKSTLKKQCTITEVPIQYKKYCLLEERSFQTLMFVLMYLSTMENFELLDKII